MPSGVRDAGGPCSDPYPDGIAESGLDARADSSVSDTDSVPVPHGVSSVPDSEFADTAASAAETEGNIHA